MNSLRFVPDQVGQMAEQGGWVFWALIVLAFGIAFALVSIVHLLRLPNAPRISGVRWLGLMRHDRDKSERWEVKELLPVVNEMPLIEQQLFAQLERRIRFTFVLIGAAPLVGLLGTVGGMLATFRGLSSASVRAPMDVISGGISEALITTQTGLVIAVPTFIVATLLKGRFDHLRSSFDQLHTAVRRCEATA